ncbi:MAG: NAD(P)H-dependent oxidoreductase subunit E, partial [Treponema sp.]|nr:NAD(P)H-dependent oxidoreductase subunit E [Treponema sp.]
MATAAATRTGDIDFPQELTAFIDEWKTKPGSLIMMLHKIQETFGFIPRPAAEKLAMISGIP